MLATLFGMTRDRLRAPLGAVGVLNCVSGVIAHLAQPLGIGIEHPDPAQRMIAQYHCTVFVR